MKAEKEEEKKEEKEKKEKKEEKKKDAILCTKHEEPVPAESVCLTCSQPLCKACCRVHMKSNNTHNIRSYVDEATRLLDYLEEALTGVTNALKRATENREELRQRVMVQCRQALRHVEDKMITTLIEVFNDAELQAVAEVIGVAIWRDKLQKAFDDIQLMMTTGKYAAACVLGQSVEQPEKVKWGNDTVNATKSKQEALYSSLLQTVTMSTNDLIAKLTDTCTQYKLQLNRSQGSSSDEAENNPDQEVPIPVQQLSGKTCTINVKLTETIGKLDLLYSAKNAFSIYQFRYFLPSRELHRHKKLQEYGITKNTLVLAILDMAGNSDVYVRFPSGKVVPIDMHDVESIPKLKEKIRKLERIPFGSIKLELDGTDLPDTYPMYNLGSQQLCCSSRYHFSQIFIKQLCGNHITIYTPKRMSIQAIKEAIYSRTSIPVEKQVLISCGTVLLDNDRVCDVLKGDTLHLVVKEAK